MDDTSQSSDRARIVREAAGRLLVSVRVTPRSAMDDLTYEQEMLRAKLHAPPVDGAANAALIALLATRLRLPKSVIRIERGTTAREKVVAIAGLSADEFWRRLGIQPRGE